MLQQRKLNYQYMQYGVRPLAIRDTYIYILVELDSRSRYAHTPRTSTSTWPGLGATVASRVGGLGAAWVGGVTRACVRRLRLMAGVRGDGVSDL